ncbi:MAG: hypothetical protein M4D80_12205 [Myxococcota bacterium]|nr:hypothetical protein [Myxococcota bacterium]
MRKPVLIALSLACVMLWLATTFVAELEQLRWLRYTLMAVLAVVEIRILIGIYRVVFTATSNAEVTERIAATGVPAPLVKLVAWEARFWRRVFRRGNDARYYE